MLSFEDARRSSWYNGDETGELDNWQYNTTRQNFLGTATIKTDFEKDFNIRLPLQTNTLLGYDYRKNVYKEFDTCNASVCSIIRYAPLLRFTVFPNDALTCFVIPKESKIGAPF